MIKSYKVKLSPNNMQNSRMFQFAGASRYVYNWSLERQGENYNNGYKFISDIDLRREFTQFKKKEENLWLNDISNDVTKQAIKDACSAYIKFFKGINDIPKFKSKKRNKPSFYQDTDKIAFSKNTVRVEKISSSRRKNRQKINFIKLCEKDWVPIDMKYMNPRFTHDGENWFVSVAIEYEDINIHPTNEPVGIDLGIKVTIANRWYPSSKLCSCCGVVKKDLKLKDRIFKCECGNVIDRDIQAAINLKNYSNYKKSK